MRIEAGRRVWVVIADFGLQGAECLAVYARELTRAELDALADGPAYHDAGYTIRQVTGYGGIDVEQATVRP